MTHDKMITAKNLEKAGFIPGGWVELVTPGYKYRTWEMKVNKKCLIEVDEEWRDGRCYNTIPWLIACKTYVRLNINSVSDLLTLKELLK